jgi:hypothetical protein
MKPIRTPQEIVKVRALVIFTINEKFQNSNMRTPENRRLELELFNKTVSSICVKHQVRERDIRTITGWSKKHLPYEKNRIN